MSLRERYGNLVGTFRLLVTVAGTTLRFRFFGLSVGNDEFAIPSGHFPEQALEPNAEAVDLEERRRHHDQRQQCRRNQSADDGNAHTRALLRGFVQANGNRNHVLMSANDVIRIGRSRVRPARIIALKRVMPSSRIRGFV